MFDDKKFPDPAYGWAGPRQHGHGPWGRHGFGMRGGFEFGPWGGPQFGRGFFGMFGSGRGRGGPQMFGRGDLKFVLLELVQDQPKHGYEMIKALEERAGGFYTPSAGAIYPTLQLLEDRGWMSSTQVDGKKVYSITDAGREALKTRESEPRGPHHHGRERFGPRGPFSETIDPALRALGSEAFETARLMRDAVFAARGDTARLEQLRTIVEQTQASLRAFIAQQSSETPPTGQPPAGSGPVQEV